MRPGASAARTDSPDEIFVAFIGDVMLRIPGLRLADAQTMRAPTYAYLFDWKSPGMNGALGSCHALELPFVFGTHGAAPRVRRLGTGGRRLRRGDDGHLAGLPPAPAIPTATPPKPRPGDTQAKPIMVLGPNIRVEHDWRGPEVGVWDAVIS